MRPLLIIGLVIVVLTLLKVFVLDDAPKNDVPTASQKN